MLYNVKILKTSVSRYQSVKGLSPHCLTIFNYVLLINQLYSKGEFIKCDCMYLLKFNSLEAVNLISFLKLLSMI